MAYITDRLVSIFVPNVIFGFGFHVVAVRTVFQAYADDITKISRIDRFPYFFSYGAPLERAGALLLYDKPFQG